MNIVENNKLIAEFMSIPVINETSGIITPMYKAVGLGGWCREDELKYNLRWDWLMPVVEKMITMYDSQCLFEHPRYTNIDDKWKFHFEALSDCKCRADGKGETMLEATYKAVIEFIKWYNKNKKK